MCLLCLQNKKGRPFIPQDRFEIAAGRPMLIDNHDSKIFSIFHFQCARAVAGSSISIGTEIFIESEKKSKLAGVKITENINGNGWDRDGYSLISLMTLNLSNDAFTTFQRLNQNYVIRIT